MKLRLPQIKAIDKKTKIICISLVVAILLTGCSYFVSSDNAISNSITNIIPGMQPRYLLGAIAVTIKQQQFPQFNLSHFHIGDKDPILGHHIKILPPPTPIWPIYTTRTFVVTFPTPKDATYEEGLNFTIRERDRYRERPNVESADLVVAQNATLSTIQQLWKNTTIQNQGFPLAFIRSTDTSTIDFISLVLDFIIYFAISILIIWLYYYYKEKEMLRHQRLYQQQQQIQQAAMASIQSVQTTMKRRRKK